MAAVFTNSGEYWITDLLNMAVTGPSDGWYIGWGSGTTTEAKTSPVTAGTYVIQPGDTLSVIAERFGISVAVLSEANGITDVNTIRPGQELNIPAPAPATG